MDGKDSFDTEELQAFELGYRLQLSAGFSLDIAAFLNTYDDLRSFEAGVATLALTPVPYLSLPYCIDNKLDGKTYGVEAAADWQLTRWRRLQPAYTFIQMDLHTDNDSSDTFTKYIIEGKTPRSSALVEIMDGATPQSTDDGSVAPHCGPLKPKESEKGP